MSTSEIHDLVEHMRDLHKRATRRTSTSVEAFQRAIDMATLVARVPRLIAVIEQLAGARG